MLQIINLRHGSVVNYNFGTEYTDYLELPIEVALESSGPVLVNGVFAVEKFQKRIAAIKLTERINNIKVETTNEYGKFSQSLKVIWDKKSFKRYNFFIDDNIFFLTDINKRQPASLFNHFYLKHLRDIHIKYAAKFTLNLFYRNDHQQFELKDFPDRYKSEWQDNSDWLKLSFHAFSEFPDRPYQNAIPERLANDYDIVQAEIIRFAGEETFQPPIVIHWAMTLPESFSILKERGVKVLSGQFLNAKTYAGEKDRIFPITDIGYYKDKESAFYLQRYGMLYDFDNELLFIKGDVCCNLLSCVQIEKELKAKCNEPERQILGLATHEQYSFDYYHNFIPDHFDRIETAVRIATEHGYQPVFFHDGFLVNLNL